MSEPAAKKAWRDRAIVQLTLTRYREFYREPEALFWTFIFPLLMAAGLGVAFRSRPPEATKIGIVSSSPAATGLAETLRREKHLEALVVDDSSAAASLRAGKIALVVRGGPDTVVLRFDENRPEASTARRLVDDAIQRGAGRSDPITVVDEHVRDPGSRYIDFLIPGLLGMNLMASSMWGIGFSVVDQRRKKLLKRFVATPMSRGQYLASFVLGRLTLMVLEVTFVLGFGALVFGVPIRAPLPVIGVICLIGAMSFGGLGLLIAARPKTIEAASGLMNLSMLPMWVFSGVFFSSSRFPDVIQPVIRALPLTAINNSLRAAMLEGAGLGAVKGDLLILLAWLLVCFPLAVRVFRWK